MRAFLFPHIDQFRRFSNPAKGGLYGGIRIADKSHYRSIRARAGIDIEQRNTIDRLNHISDLPNNIVVTPLRKIRHALD
jgi:hypothetical protein